MGEGIDPDWLRWAFTGALVFLSILSVLVVVFVRGVMAKVLILAVIVVVGFLLWSQRGRLEDCIDSCNCQWLWMDIADEPPCQAPAALQDR